MELRSCLCVLKDRGNVVARIGNRRLAEQQGAFLPHQFKCIATNGEVLDAAEVPPDVRKIQRISSYACEDLATLASMLKLKKAHPFTGLWIELNANHLGPCEPTLESDFQIISSRVPMKYLRIEIWFDRNEHFGNDWRGNCEVMPYLDLILKDHAHQLVQLELLGWQNFCFRENLPCIPIGFPLLKILFWVNPWPLNPSDNEFVKTIVAHAPNLQELHSLPGEAENVEELMEFLYSALEGSKAVLVNSRATSMSAARFYNRLAVRGRNVLFLSDDILDAQDFEARMAVLGNSRDTLLDARLNTLFFAQIVMNGTQFSKLSQLQLSLKLSYLTRECPALLKVMCGKGFFGRIFPKLQLLSLSEDDYLEDPDPNFMTNVMADHAAANLISMDLEPSPSYIVSLPEALMIDCSLRLDEMEFLEDIRLHRLMFSRVDRLTPWVWHFLPSMQWLQLCLRAEDPIDGFTLDSILCGVHPEEVEELRRKDTVYLKSVHVVPVHPPITYLRSLTQFSVDFVHRQEIQPPSKVSAALCFDRMPGLLIRADNESEIQIAELRKVQEDLPELRFFLSSSRGLN